jgi:ankyrin repeat protein
MTHHRQKRVAAGRWMAPVAAILVLHQLAELVVSDAGRSTLHIAAERGDLVLVNELLRTGAAADEVDWANETALVKASRFGNTAVVRTLLEAGATAQVQLALPIAARYGHAEVLRLLLQAGAMPDAVDTRTEYDTPLMIASTYGQTAAAIALLEGGARANAQNGVGRTALICAANEGHADTVGALVDGGARVDLVDSTGTPPLVFASRAGHRDAAQALLDGGAAVDEPAGNDSTALMAASMQGFVAVAQLLIAAGANPNARTSAPVPLAMHCSIANERSGVRRKQGWVHTTDGSRVDGPRRHRDCSFGCRGACRYTRQSWLDGLRRCDVQQSGRFRPASDAAPESKRRDIE